MNIVLTFDNNYCQHAAVVITSFCQNNHDSNNIFVVSDYISDENKSKIESCVNGTQTHIIYIKIDATLYSNFPIGKGTSNNYITSLATYYRLFLLDLLPQDVDRVIYIDCDVVVCNSLHNFWTIELPNDKCIAAVEEMPNIVAESTKRLNIETSYSYFNAGVILIDIQKLKQYFSSEIASNFISKNKQIIKYHDQDVLNALLKDKKVFVSIRFNLMEGFLYRLNSKKQRCAESDIFHPAIIHFAGPLKPWYSECNHPYRQYYYKYLLQTPWSEYIPTCRYKTGYERIKFAAIETLKNILDTVHIRAHRFRTDLPKNIY